ncbi:hypothetical protein [Streptomyces sp. NPDC004856]|uniref:CBU_0592 family membrane protein n=1 Tax=unclassified Streptomyces TaxID=2593676 RepID=UPI0033B53E69
MQAIATYAATAAGWVGALSTAAAYLLVSRRVIQPDAQTFQLINMLGGALLAVSAAASGAWPSVTSNFVWVLIGVQALVGARSGARAVAGRVTARFPRRRGAERAWSRAPGS